MHSATTDEGGLRAARDILRAAHFAARHHAAQRRKGAAAEPYVNHVLEVADSIARVLTEPDTNLVIAGLLHDVVEDADVTKEELAEQFGSDVANLVMEVTDDKKLKKEERKRLQVVNAPKKSVRAQVIKLADKVSNVRSILASPPAGWDVERKRDYFEWAKQVVDGLTSPNAILKEEFEQVYRMSEHLK